MHQLTIFANVGSQPKKHTFESGKEIIEFSIAESVTDHNGEKSTIWHDVRGFGNVVNLPINSGDYVNIIGKLRYNIFNDKEGRKQVRSYILADKVYIIQKLPKKES